MGTISMWIIKQIFKKKLKKIKQDNPNTSTMALLSSTTNGDIKKLKNRIKILNILISIMLFITLVTGIVGTALVFSTSHTAMAVAANAILSILDDDKKKEEEDKKDGWEWEKHDGDNAGGGGGGSSSGGLYPKDRGLKLRAQLIEIAKNSCQETNRQTGKNVYYSHILGTMFKETQHSFFSEIDRLNTQDLYSELVVPNPACCKHYYGMSCSYMNNGVSHFYGGSVSGGADQGDPYTQVINTSRDSYDGDHAVSFAQLEIPYIYDPTTEFYMNYGSFEPVTSSSNPSTAQQEVQVDPDLGFIRPNTFYIPDVIWNVTYYVSKYYGDKGQSLNGYSSLSDYNKSCVDFLIAMTYYSGGGLKDSRKAIIEQLISRVNSGEVQYIDDLGLSLADKYWDKDNNTVIGPGIVQFGKDFKSLTGIDLGPVGTFREVLNGMFALFLGRAACEDMEADIESAEKEGGGTANNSGSGDINSTELTVANMKAYGEQFIGCPYQFGAEGQIFNAQTCATLAASTGGKNAWNVLGSSASQYEGMQTFDCSGLTLYIYKHYGYSLGHYTGTQEGQGTPVSKDNLKFGDLVFFTKPGESVSHHVGIYWGDGNFLEAPYTGAFVTITPLSSRSDFSKAVRIAEFD